MKNILDIWSYYQLWHLLGSPWTWVKIPNFFVGLAVSRCLSTTPHPMNRVYIFFFTLWSYVGPPFYIFCGGGELQSHKKFQLYFRLPPSSETSYWLSAWCVLTIAIPFPSRRCQPLTRYERAINLFLLFLVNLINMKSEEILSLQI